jgi:predicted CoA-binding protein
LRSYDKVMVRVTHLTKDKQRASIMAETGIGAFLAGDAFAVAGASDNRAKFGNKVLRCYLQHGHTVYPINPHATTVEGIPCYPDLATVPQPIHGVSIITPPAVTAEIVDQAIVAGIKHLWMQPGAEHRDAITRAEQAGINVIAGGPCLLVELGFREHG